ncbi:hypothetical protein MMC10_010152 [Thelotrema lepadinum]|nr:hypothetical protein [Thelotrema lepadinum]
MSSSKFGEAENFQTSLNSEEFQKPSDPISPSLLNVTNTVVLLHLHENNFASFIDYENNGGNPRGILSDIANGLYYDESTTKWVDEDVKKMPSTWTHVNSTYDPPASSNGGYGAISVKYGFSDDELRVIRTVFMVLVSASIASRLDEMHYTAPVAAYQTENGHLIAGLSSLRNLSAGDTVRLAENRAEISPIGSDSESGWQWNEHRQSFLPTTPRLWERVSDLVKNHAAEAGFKEILHVWSSKEHTSVP